MDETAVGGGTRTPVLAFAQDPVDDPKAPRDDIRAYGLGYVYLCEKIMQVTGIDLTYYKPNQMHRRLSSFAAKCGYTDLYRLASSIEKDASHRKHLVDFLTINVSSFFRNPEQWEILKSLLSPPTLNREGLVKAWSAGSSTGQEAYSAAMILAEIGIRHFLVLATDIDRVSLAKGREGKYTKQEVADIPGLFLGKYFRAEEGEYWVREELKKRVDFRQHNLLAQGAPEGFDLALCRNVLIYLTEAGRERAVFNLAASLKPGGLLFIGCTETLPGAQKHGLSQIYPFFYIKEKGR